MKVEDMPKIESPFVRKEINGDYLVTPEIAEGYDWVFNDESVMAIEKLHGTNVSIFIQGGVITGIWNRTERLPFFNKGAPGSREGDIKINMFEQIKNPKTLTEEERKERQRARVRVYNRRPEIKARLKEKGQKQQALVMGKKKDEIVSQLKEIMVEKGINEPELTWALKFAEEFNRMPRNRTLLGYDKYYNMMDKACIFVYLAHIKTNNPMSLDEVANLFGIDEQRYHNHIGKGYRVIKKLLNLKYCGEQVENTCLIVRTPLDFFKQINMKGTYKDYPKLMLETETLLTKMADDTEFMGRNPQVVLGALFITL